MILISCNSPKLLKEVGDQHIIIFSGEHLNFDPDLYKNASNYAKNGTIRIKNGRILLKRIQLPVYERDVKIKAKINLRSAGDRWDKSGSCFVIPKESEVDFLKIVEEESGFPHHEDSEMDYIGIVPVDNYFPAIELIRFMTPFGIGAYSDSMDFRRPVYIPKWETDVTWEQDISDLIRELEGEILVGVWIDTWTKEGYEISFNIDFDETDAKYLPRKNLFVKSLVNTVPYIGPQKLPDLFANKDLKVSFPLHKSAKNIKLKYIVTGHGGHAEGDEFVERENIIYVNNQVVKKFVPWRSDCASFRRFNPGSGVWLISDTAQYIDWNLKKYTKKVIEERIASSDLSRSNWCPGSDVDPVSIKINDLIRDINTLKISIPEAQPISENKMNHWLVSAYVVWEE